MASSFPEESSKDARQAEPAAGPRQRPAVGGSGSLEHFQNVVDPNQNGSPQGLDTFEVATCGCDCWYCPDCCVHKGMNLRARLIPVLQTFSSIMMLTLTVDPLLFPSPQDAYFYIRRKRAIGELMRTLDRSGYLTTRRYFCVVEFQKQTEQAHFHVLIESGYLPKPVVDARWSLFRPNSAGPTDPNRPAFGMTRFSVGSFEGGPVHAARYATKYLTKTPEQGWPAWVMDLGAARRIPRYHTSRGFWNEPPRQAPATKGKPRQPTGLSYAQRIADCGTAITLFKITESVDVLTGDPRTDRRWLARGLCDRDVLVPLSTSRNPRRPRVRLTGASASEALRTLRDACGHPIPILATSGAVPTGAPE